LAAFLAPAASASLVPAKFSATSFKFVGSGAVTLKRSGTEATTCELKTPLEGGQFGSQSVFLVGNASFGEARWVCLSSPNNYLEMVYMGEAQYDTVTGVYSLRVSDYNQHTLLSPYGSYWQESEGKDRGTWTNGSGTTPPTVTFTEAKIGRDTSGKPITFSGTMKVTTLSGGLVTLSH